MTLVQLKVLLVIGEQPPVDTLTDVILEWKPDVVCGEKWTRDLANGCLWADELGFQRVRNRFFKLNPDGQILYRSFDASGCDQLSQRAPDPNCDNGWQDNRYTGRDTRGSLDTRTRKGGT